MSSGWVRWAESRVLEAADLGGFVVRSRRVSGRSHYLKLHHPVRGWIVVRVSDHRPAWAWVTPAGRPVQAFSVIRTRTLDHVVRVLTSGSLSVAGGGVGLRSRPAPGERTPERGEAAAESAADLDGGSVEAGQAPHPTAHPEPHLASDDRTPELLELTG